MDQEQDMEIEELAAQEVVELANQIAEDQPEADLWAIADGLLAGAVHFWLFSRMPCDDKACEDCLPLATSEARMAVLRQLVEEVAVESDYYHTPNDSNAGHA